MIKKLLTLLISTFLISTPVQASQIDMQTYFPLNSQIESLFDDEYEEPITMYTTTNLNLRSFPNIKAEIADVLPEGKEVIALSDFAGWMKVKIGNNDTEYYLWDEYLTTEQPVYHLGRFKLTAYCACSKCCGKWAGGETASGTTPTQGKTVAMAGVPFGTRLRINDHIYTVEDRGTAYGHVDIFFSNHSEALQFGMQYADVYEVK